MRSIRGSKDAAASGAGAERGAASGFANVAGRARRRAASLRCSRLVLETSLERETGVLAACQPPYQHVATATATMCRCRAAAGCCSATRRRRALAAAVTWTATKGVFDYGRALHTTLFVTRARACSHAAVRLYRAGQRRRGVRACVRDENGSAVNMSVVPVHSRDPVESAMRDRGKMSIQ